MPDIASLEPGERLLLPEFSGTTNEYFRIWVVNLLFTLLTLGIFSAWAKVRKKRYFYGNTRMDSNSFDYTASPKAIFKGRLIAAAIVVAYLLTGELVPGANVAFWIAGLLALPWLATRALAFNARNSAWRGVRFDFTATGSQAARQMLPRLVVVGISFGTALPWFLARLRAFVLRHHAYGSSGCECEIPARGFYGAYLRAFGLAFALSLPLAGFFWAWHQAEITPPDSLAWAPIAVSLALNYCIYTAAYAIVQARTANLAWSAVRVPGMRFSCTLEGRAMARLYLVNLAAIIATAGLAIPWATIRAWRYRVSRFAVIADPAHTHRANPALPAIGAAGQELGDLFNLDLGL